MGVRGYSSRTDSTIVLLRVLLSLNILVKALSPFLHLRALDAEEGQPALGSNGFSEESLA